MFGKKPFCDHDNKEIDKESDHSYYKQGSSSIVQWHSPTSFSPLLALLCLPHIECSAVQWSVAYAAEVTKVSEIE